eukprot:jgi/Botrbrau1/1951/Bobra.0005s0043.1
MVQRSRGQVPEVLVSASDSTLIPGIFALGGSMWDQMQIMGSKWEQIVLPVQCSSHKFGNPLQVFLPQRRLYRSTPLLKEMHKLLV